MFVMRAGPAPAVDAGRMRARDLAHFLGVGVDRCSVAGSSRGTGGLGVAGPDLFLRVVAGWGAVPVRAMLAGARILGWDWHCHTEPLDPYQAGNLGRPGVWSAAVVPRLDVLPWRARSSAGHGFWERKE